MDMNELAFYAGMREGVMSFHRTIERMAKEDKDLTIPLIRILADSSIVTINETMMKIDGGAELLKMMIKEEVKNKNEKS